MKFFCPSCNQKISADDTQAGTKALCPGCGVGFEVPFSDANDQTCLRPTQGNPLEIFVVKGGYKTGPFKSEQLRPMVDSGMLSLLDSVWHDGLADWIPLHRFLDVKPPLTGWTTAPPALESPISFPPGQPSRPKKNQTSGWAMVSALCGMLVIHTSFLQFPVFAAIPALITGLKARSQIRKSNGMSRGRGFANLGIILGIAGMCLQLFTLVWTAFKNPNHWSRSDVASTSSTYEFRVNSPVTLSGVYSESFKSSGGGISFNNRIIWDFRSNGSVSQRETVGIAGDSNGVNFGFSGTYTIAGRIISVILENGSRYSFEMEGNGDLISRSDQNDGARLEKLQ